MQDLIRPADAKGDPVKSILGAGSMSKVLLLTLDTQQSSQDSVPAPAADATAETLHADGGMLEGSTAAHKASSADDILDEQRVMLACKVYNKNRLLVMNHLPHAMSERNILLHGGLGPSGQGPAQIAHPFIQAVPHSATFQDDLHLYLLLEPALGGVLRTHLRFDTMISKQAGASWVLWH